MKKLPFLAPLYSLAVLITACATSNTPIKESYAAIIPEIRAPKAISYDDESYQAGYSAVMKTGALVEYFRKGQGPGTWTKMIALRTTQPPATPDAEVHELVSLVRSRGATGEGFKNSKTGEAGVEFLLPKSGDLEFNLFRYVPQTGAQGTKSLQYAELIPSSKFGKDNLRSIRQTHLTQFLALKIPEIRLEE